MFLFKDIDMWLVHFLFSRAVLRCQVFSFLDQAGVTFTGNKKEAQLNIKSETCQHASK